MPKISVIIPIYKVEPYLDACIDSVVKQTYTDMEIILVDDGSPDNCPAMCDAWAKRDSRIRVIHEENKGQSAARNNGLDIATGDFIAFADSDDRLEPDILEKALARQQRDDADLVIFNYICVNEKGNLLKEPDYTIFHDEQLAAENLWDRFFSCDDRCSYYVVPWNKLYRAEIFRTLRYAPVRRCEDAFLLPSVIDKCKKISCMGYQGYQHRLHNGSIMAQGNLRSYLERSEYLLEWTTCFAAKGDYLRAEGLLNDAIANLAEKERFDLSTPAQQACYRADCKACADAYHSLARQTGNRSMYLRAALLRLGLPVYQAFLKHKA